MEPVVIIGSGMAGYNVARELRKLDRDVPLTLLSSDSAHFYSKPMLSSSLGSQKAPESLPQSDAAQMQTQLAATVRAHVVVTAIDTAASVIRLGDESLPYSQLVLALGADQIRVPVGGDAADAVMTVNDLAEYTRFRAAIAGRKHVTVIGAGLIGCEFANDLRAGGFEVSVVDIAGAVLSRLLPPAGSAFLQRTLAELGVDWRLGTSISTVDADGERLRVTLANGDVLSTDVVLSAVGLRPRVALAQRAGLAVARGIVVDRALRTSVDNVFALGDCAEVNGHVLPYVMPLMQSARALAATLAGKHTHASYPAMPVMVKTPACPTIVSPPAAGAVGEWSITETPDGVQSLFLAPDGALLGFALNGKATSERMALIKRLPPVMA